MNNPRGAQPLPIQFPSRPRSSYMSGIQPYFGAFLNIRGRISSMNCSLFLCRLAPSNFHSEMLENLLHRCLDIIGTHASLISLLHWFCLKWHPGIPTLNRIIWGTLRCLRCSIIWGELCQRKPLNSIVLLMIHKRLKLLVHTSNHSFHLSICLRVKSCWHPQVNPQSTAHLLPESSRKLRTLIGNNG